MNFSYEVSFLCAVWYKYALVQNNYIYTEEFIALTCLLTGSFIIFGFIGVFMGDEDTTLRRIINNIWTCCAAYCYCFIETYWVMRQYEKQLVANKDISESIKKVQLEDMLKDKDGFYLFANHLVKEFSIENLMFVFEVMQIKYEVIQHGYVALYC